ncbi:MAG: hypothetical protein IRY99_21660 [Isosphaeraceae bacterium]|nr:hypothetical protein [Isosphaeraceae bacterium]
MAFLYRDWLDAAPGRRLLYVPRDFDAESEYWSEVLARLPQDAPAKLREGAQRRRDETKSWAGHLPPRAKDPAPAEVWFAVAEASGPPILCKTLSGEWAAGIDPAAAAVTRHQTLKADNEEHVLLEGDGRVLAMEWWWDEPTTRVLVLANGSFLLNEPLLHRARRPLALRVVRWIGPAPRQIVFVESRSPTEAQAEEMPSPFALLGIDPFGWIAAHLGVFALLACLAASVRLGRPRPAPAPGSDRPAAHAEAIGDLLARTRDAAAARALLDAYRRWRHPPSPAPAARARRH